MHQIFSPHDHRVKNGIGWPGQQLTLGPLMKLGDSMNRNWARVCKSPQVIIESIPGIVSVLFFIESAGTDDSVRQTERLWMMDEVG